MAKQPVWGAEAIKASQERSKAVQKVVKKKQGKIKPVKTMAATAGIYNLAVPQALINTSGLLAANAVGLFGLGGAAMTTNAVLRYSARNVVRAYDGQTLFTHGVNYTKYVLFSEFRDMNDPSNRSHYMYYSGVRPQKLERNASNVLCSWFGIDENTAGDREVEQEKAQEQAAVQAERERLFREEQEKQRRAMIIPQMLSSYAMMFLRDPAVREKFSRSGLERDEGHNIDDEFKKYADNTIGFDTGRMNTRDIHGNRYHNRRQPESEYNEYPSDNPGLNDSDSPNHDGPNGPNPNGPTPTLDGGEYFGLPKDGDYKTLDDEFYGINSNDELIPASEIKEGDQVLVPLYEDTSELSFMSYDAKLAEEALRLQMDAEKENWAEAVVSARSGFADVDDVEMCNQLQTLHNYGKMDYLMSRLETGQVQSHEEIKQIEDEYEAQWSEFESNRLMPMYGDRIKNGFKQMGRESEFEAQITPVKEEVPSYTASIDDKEAFQKSVLENKKKARQRIAQRASASNIMTLDKAVEPKTERYGALKNLAKSFGKDAVIAVNNYQANMAKSNEPVYVEALQSDVAQIETEPLMIEDTTPVAEATVEVKTESEHKLEVAAENLIEKAEEVGIKEPVAQPMATVPVVEASDTSSRNNGRLTPQMQELLAQQEAETDYQLN